MKQGYVNNHKLTVDETEKRCIWMAAGVIAYKLCPLQFDCDRCEFDTVMKQKQCLPGSSEPGTTSADQV